MATIAIVNNMPTAAMQSTERQFQRLLSAASGGTCVEIRWYRLSGARPEYYEPLANLWNSTVDGLIVTGVEPRKADLREEPFWPLLADTIDWAKRHTRSAIFSCLAAHAAVLHLDGIPRQRQAKKVFGLFASLPVTRHPLLEGLEFPWPVPHSRWNELRTADLERAGYQILTSGEAGCDMFVKWCGESLFLLMQGHPEYDVASLLREYHRDLLRFDAGKMDRRPSVPKDYFDADTARQLERLAPRDTELGMALSQAALPDDWYLSAVQIYRNWLTFLHEQRVVLEG